MQRLEAHRLANPDPSLRFVLLSDFGDAPLEHAPEDKQIEDELLAGIRRLNERYGSAGGGPFHLLHRAAAAKSLRELLDGVGTQARQARRVQPLRPRATRPRALPSARAISTLSRGVRFVVTLDADTTLPPGAVNRLAGTLAHPLNSALRRQVRAASAPATRSCSRGSRSRRRAATARCSRASMPVIRQSTSTAAPSPTFIRICSAKASTSARASTTSRPSIRASKGACRRMRSSATTSSRACTGARRWRATSSSTRTFPASYVDYARRWHRWVRGDWQLLPWLAGTVPGGDGRALRQPACRYSTAGRSSIIFAAA